MSSCAAFGPYGGPGNWRTPCTEVPAGSQTQGRRADASDRRAAGREGVSGKAYPPTAQHAMREGTRVGRNIEALLRGRPENVRPFRYKMIGQLAAIGHLRGIASIFGFRFSGFIAWLLWRGAYLFKLPGTVKKIRVMLEWLLDLCFPRDTVQLLSLQSVRSRRLEEVTESARTVESAEAAEAGPRPAPVQFG